MTHIRPKSDGPAATSGAKDGLLEYGPALHRFLSRRVPNEHAGDLVHEVYERFIAAARHEVIRHPRAFLYRLASNLVYEFRLRQKRSRVVFDSELVTLLNDRYQEANEADPVDQLNASRELQRLLAKLPKKYQAVVVMRLHLGMTPEETGAELGIATTTVYRYLVDALTIMKTQFFEPNNHGRNT